MGAGRRTETHVLSERSRAPSSSSSSVNCSVTARNLRKSELGGVIFGCKHNTMNQCFQMQLFGLPSGHISYVKNIGPGLPLFLFNYSDRMLHGIFEAASSGRLNINPYGWTEGSSDCTPYAAQVKFKTRMQFQPLSEVQFSPVIEDNYYLPKLFWFELDQVQTKKLISLFSASTPIAAQSIIPRSIPKLPSSNSAYDGRSYSSLLRNDVHSTGDLKNSQTRQIVPLSNSVTNSEYDGRSYSSLLRNDVHPTSDLKHIQTGQTSLETTHGLNGHNESVDEIDHKGALEQTMLNLPTEDQMNNAWDSPCIGSSLNGGSNTSEEFIDESTQCDEQFEYLKQHMEDLYLSVSADRCLPRSIPCESMSTPYLQSSASEGNTSWSYKSEIENCCFPEAELHLNAKSPDLRFIFDKIQQEVNELRLKQFKQELQICSLEKELVESRREIVSLKQQLKTSDCVTFPKEDLVMRSKSSYKESILIMGGFDGLTCVSTLDCYCPTNDLLETLCPMSSIRSYNSTVKLSGEVYVIGGLQDNLWCDTVESYNLVENQWFTRPSVHQKKGSLAGISLNDKIFAIGGGNGVQCFSEVESFDPNVGKWIPTRSMMMKRFTPAAAEINGVIYVVGGFDGDNYLRSVERYDPRGNSWARLQNMSTMRGCHSLSVLNEQLYAIGGYNGEQMISTVEIFDPRTGSWIMSEPMNTSRGYFATVVIGNSIFAIGGLSESNEVLDTIECYKEGRGWESTNLKALGRRCYLSAILL
ncbi:hypothetical protein HN51_058584 [Arachis hypogaea]|uniref:DCD domain-containing protein n=1 Tax=Arachis hypogaea TaxID=3818 RepID=A0A444X1Q1_ARAHY|nr:ring canal kelch homolog [Arachis ipaensis]XP_016181942.1 ring canal kelch homolog [Arachis ipaensis]XP_025682180.1 ring canal kelch homolog [Arachis hypogaea]QHN81888.1 uncharacterized protein DS421_20g690860 [Arachis hypogaea]RYQ83601.1 hypothetical protein Ahy_B10g102345 [Arachis hypogaea]